MDNMVTVCDKGVVVVAVCVYEKGSTIVVCCQVPSIHSFEGVLNLISTKFASFLLFITN